MDKKRKVFVIGLVVLMVVFTVVNFIISRNYILKQRKHKSN